MNLKTFQISIKITAKMKIFKKIILHKNLKKKNNKKLNHLRNTLIRLKKN